VTKKPSAHARLPAKAGVNEKAKGKKDRRVLFTAKRIHIRNDGHYQAKHENEQAGWPITTQKETSKNTWGTSSFAWLEQHKY